MHQWCQLDPSRLPAPPPQFPFTGTPGLHVTEQHDPLGYLRLSLDDSLIDKIVIETNSYVDQTSASHTKPFARDNRWEPVTLDDILVFLGLIILQGILGKAVQ